MRARIIPDRHVQRGNGRAAIMRVLGPRLAAAWQAMLLAMMLAVAWQGFVAQTHRHPEGELRVAAATVLVDVALSGDHQTPLKLPDSCPICRELGHAGSMLLPVLAEITPPAQVAEPRSDLRLAAPAHARPLSHAWRSRAPPQLRQA